MIETHINNTGNSLKLLIYCSPSSCFYCDCTEITQALSATDKHQKKQICYLKCTLLLMYICIILFEI